MDLAFATIRAQRVLLAVAVVASAVLINVGDGDIFALPKATAIAVCAVLAVGLAAVRWAWIRRVSVPVEPATVAAYAFVAALTVTTSTSTTPMQSLVGQYSQNAGLAAYAAYVVLFVVVLRVHSPKTLPALLRAFVASTLLVVGYAVLQIVDVDPVDWSLKGRVVGTLGNPNFLAGWVGIVLPLALWAAVERGHHVAWRVAGAVAAAAIPLVAWKTASFQGPVTVGASAIAFVLLAVRIPRRHLLGGAAVVLVALVVLSPRVRDEIDNGLLERKHFWRAAVDVGLDHPVVGTGPDTFHNQFLSRRTIEHARVGGENAGAAHDVPLDMLAGGGFLTLLPYLAFVGLVGWRLLRAAGDRRLLLAGIGAAWFGYQVQSLVSIDKPPLAFAHFVLAGMVLVAAGPIRWLDVTIPGTPVRRNQVPAATWAASAVAVVAALVLAFVVSRPLRADLAYDAGLDALRRGDASGIDGIEHALDLAPYEATYTFQLARGRLALDDPDGAIAAAEEGARLEPGDGSYALVPAQLASRLERDDLAVRWFDEALRRDRYGVPELMAAAEHAAVIDDVPRAEALVDRMLAISRSNVSIWRSVYAVRAKIGDNVGAGEARRAALRLDPEVRLREASR